MLQTSRFIITLLFIRSNKAFCRRFDFSFLCLTSKAFCLRLFSGLPLGLFMG